jgi:hypothetical protein
VKLALIHLEIDLAEVRRSYGSSRNLIDKGGKAKEKGGLCGKCR